MREKQKKLLLELRSKLVGKLHVQPYIIYGDETVELLLNKQPKTIEELSKVKGFPPKGKRVAGFGESVIAIFQDAEKISEIEITDTNKGITVGVQTKKMGCFS